MKELESYIQSVNTCSDSLIREVWSDQDECSMIFPKGEVEGLDAILASFYHGAMAQYETAIRREKMRPVRLRFISKQRVCISW